MRPTGSDRSRRASRGGISHVTPLRSRLVGVGRLRGVGRSCRVSCWKLVQTDARLSALENKPLTNLNLIEVHHQSPDGSDIQRA